MIKIEFGHYNLFFKFCLSSHLDDPETIFVLIKSKFAIDFLYENNLEETGASHSSTR